MVSGDSEYLLLQDHYRWDQVRCVEVISTRTSRAHMVRPQQKLPGSCTGLINLSHGPCYKHVFFLSLSGLCYQRPQQAVKANFFEHFLFFTLISTDPELSYNTGHKVHYYILVPRGAKCGEYIRSFILKFDRCENYFTRGRCIVSLTMWLMISAVWGLNSNHTRRQRRKSVYGPAWRRMAVKWLSATFVGHDSGFGFFEALLVNNSIGTYTGNPRWVSPKSVHDGSDSHQS